MFHSLACCVGIEEGWLIRDLNVSVFILPLFAFEHEIFCIDSVGLKLFFAGDFDSRAFAIQMIFQCSNPVRNHLSKQLP